MCKPPILLALALLLACSSSSSDSASGESKTGEAKSGDASASELSIPALPLAAPIPAGAPQLTLSSKGVSLGDETLVEADLSQALPASQLEQTLGEPVRAALTKAHEGAGDKPLLIAGDAGVPFGGLGVLMTLAERAGFERCGLVVQTKPDERSMIPVRLVASTPTPNPRALHVVMRPSGYDLNVGPPMAPEPGAPPTKPTIPRKAKSGGLYDTNDWDTEALGAKVVQFLERAPDRRLTVMVDDGITLDELVVTLAALRGPECGAADDPKCRVEELVVTQVRTGALGAPPKLGLVGAGANANLDPGSTGLLGAGKGGSGVAKVVIDGPLDPSIVRRIVRVHEPEVRACHSSALAKNPTLAGRLTIDFEIGLDGKIASASVGESTLADEGVAKCVLGKVKKWAFPKPNGAVKVSHPFVLAPK